MVPVARRLAGNLVGYPAVDGAEHELHRVVDGVRQRLAHARLEQQRHQQRLQAMVMDVLPDTALLKVHNSRIAACI